MSLIKSFDFNFLKQNYRKSKGGIILSLIIVPLLISIYLVIEGLNVNSYQFISTNDFGNIDLFFMYIIPFVYSVFLFGFVFKKNSTDFINSMPINRKTIFVTNTIGGIILITIIQLLAGLFVLLWGAIFKNLIIFPTSVLETIILSWFSYIFVFISANLAMTFSGTLQAQFVITILVLFLIPVSAEMVEMIKGYQIDLSITEGYTDTNYNLLEEIKDYTMPFKFLRYGFMGYGFDFSWFTILKMLILSIIYYYIGLKLYQKRKMENNEEAFGSTKLQIFVKFLTLIPILFFVNINFSSDITEFIVALILSGIYYYIFDLIVKRQIRLKYTIISFFISILVIQSSLLIMKNFVQKDDEINIDYDNIKAFSIGLNSNAKSYYFDRRLSFFLFDGDYFIEDKKLLDLIIKDKEKTEKNGNYLYNRNETEDLSFENNEEKYYTNNSLEDLYFNIKLNSGKEYYTWLKVSSNCYEKILNYLENNEEYIEHIKDSVVNKNGIYRIGDNILGENKVIDKKINDSIENANLKNINLDVDAYYIIKSIYYNHRIVFYEVPITIDDELFKTVAEFSNSYVTDCLKDYKYGLNVTVYDGNNRVNDLYSVDKKIVDFIEKHLYDEFDPNKKYYILRGSIYTEEKYKSFLFYTNSTMEMENLINYSY